jgi:hypothetical protein
MSAIKRTPLSTPTYIYPVSARSPLQTPLHSSRSVSSLLLASSKHNTSPHQHTIYTSNTDHQAKASALSLPRTSPMGRHSNEASPSIIHTSSIALLQERFRNLQKVKEMREGRELQRVHATDTADRAGSVPSLNHGLQAAHHSTEQPTWFSHPDLIRPSSRPQLHTPAYGFDTPSARTSAPPPTSWGGMQNSSFRSDVDVDTSLHL